MEALLTLHEMGEKKRPNTKATIYIAFPIGLCIATVVTMTHQQFVVILCRQVRKL